VLRSVLKLVLGEASAFLEESIIDISSDAFKRDLLRGGEDIGGVDSAEGNSVNGIGASDKEVA